VLELERTKIPGIRVTRLALLSAVSMKIYVRGASSKFLDGLVRNQKAISLTVNPLMVSEGDGSKKRYKAYRKWLMGKSLFKQQRVD